MFLDNVVACSVNIDYWTFEVQIFRGVHEFFDLSELNRVILSSHDHFDNKTNMINDIVVANS